MSLSPLPECPAYWTNARHVCLKKPATLCCPATPGSHWRLHLPPPHTHTLQEHTNTPFADPKVSTATGCTGGSRLSPSPNITSLYASCLSLTPRDSFSPPWASVSHQAVTRNLQLAYFELVVFELLRIPTLNSFGSRCISACI